MEISDTVEFNIRKMKDLRLLLVDDEEDMITLLKLLFSKVGFENVTVENSGIQALESYKKNKPDIIFLDIVMPDMSGYRVYEEIRAFDHEIPIIFTYGKIGVEGDKEFQRVRSLEDKNYDIIRKPFTMEDMFEVISKVMNV